MKKPILLLLVLMTPILVKSQTLKDSVDVLYQNYFDLLKSHDSIAKISNSVEQLNEKLLDFNDVLTSNNNQIQKITQNELFTLEDQLQQRKKKIINTSDFIYVANVSLNAIKQFDATTAYLNKISSLNNPQNTDLGFSLNKEMEEILEKNVIKGKSKVNKVKTNKFRMLVENIIDSPLTESFATAIPVVGAIHSVVDLVIGTSVQGNDISVEEVSDLKKSLQVYIAHYEGLSKAQVEFDQNLANLSIRKQALISLVNQFTIERINTLYPGSLEASSNKNLTSLINDHYDKDRVEREVEAITAGNPTDYRSHLNNNRLLYPNYTISQAKFIRDEIETLGKEYISIYKSYQEAIETVLNKSKSIGDPKSIEAIINELNQGLVLVENNFQESLNIQGLNLKFRQVLEY